MDKYGWCFVQRNTKALFDMLTRNWAIMGFKRHIIYSKCNTMTRYASTCLTICFAMYGLWPSSGIIQCTYTSPTIFTNYETRLLVEFGFCHSIELTPWHSWYVLVMIKHFSKWLELVPLPNYNSEGVVYAFLDKVLSRLGAPSKVFTNQGMKFRGEFQ